jgi:hypothetical protein
VGIRGGGLVGLVGYNSDYLLSAREHHHGIRNGFEASDSEGRPKRGAGLGSGSDGRRRQCYRQWALYDVVDWVVGPPSRLGVRVDVCAGVVVWATRWVVVSLLFFSGLLAGPSDLLR